MPRPPGAKKKIAQFFLEHVGEIIDGKQLSKVAGISAWARRIRELRAEGWPIDSINSDRSLKSTEYRLAEKPPDIPLPTFSKNISRRLRALILDRNGNVCMSCGAAAGEKNEYGEITRLHIGHIKDKSVGGKNTMENLKAMCSVCNEGARNLATEPPSFAWLKGQVNRAQVDDQREVLRFLTKKFKSEIDS